MKIIRFELEKKENIGCLINDNEIVKLNNDGNMCQFLSQENWLDSSKEKVEKKENIVKLEDVKLLSPLKDSEKIFTLGPNYKQYSSLMTLPTQPFFACRFKNSIIGDGDNIVLPEVIECADWEVELVIVIGKTCKNVSEENAKDFIAGYMLGNDVSGRDIGNGQFTPGKVFDTFCPLGQFIAVDNEIDPNNVQLKCTVNGDERQNANTKDFVFNVFQVVSFISKLATLKPGDFIMTGTPLGCGMHQDPKVFLKKGDVVVCEGEGLGKLTNKCV